MPKSKPLHEMNDAELKQEFLTAFATLDPLSQRAINRNIELLEQGRLFKIRSCRK